MSALERGVARLHWLGPGLIQIRQTMLTGNRKLLDAIRDTRKTLYAVSAFYVAVGFILAIVSLNAGALLGTFLGFLIISGTLAVAALLRAVLRTDVQVSGLRVTMNQVGDRLDRLERAVGALGTVPASVWKRGGVGVVDSDERCSDEITAATLDRDAFPRLVTLLDKSSVARATELDTPAERPASLADSTARTHDGGARRIPTDVACENDETGEASLNVQRMWRHALRDGDLSAARRAFSALVEVVDPAEIDGLRANLVDLQHRVERTLRRAVSRCVARRDIDGLLEVIREIRTQLPGHPMADECAKLESALRTRAEVEERQDPIEGRRDQDEDSGAPPGAVETGSSHVGSLDRHVVELRS